MVSAARAGCAALFFGIVCAGSLPAQSPDARVAPRGVVRLQVGGGFAQFDARFGTTTGAASGERAPLSAPFPTRLTAASLTPLGTLQTAINTFYSAVGGGTPAFAAGGETLFLTTDAVTATTDHREVPFLVEVGVLPRISVRARVPLAQQRLGAVGMTIADGTIGINPDRNFNRELMSGINAAYAGLGGSGLLPTSSSAAGRELQDRVRAATGGSQLRLPEQPLSAVGVTGLAAEAPLRTGRYDPAQPLWGLGDAEVSLRFQIAGGTGRPARGAPERVAFRSAVEAGIRLPTGAAPAADYLVLPPPDQGIAGWVAALHGEVRPGDRLTARAAVRWESLQPATIGRRGWAATTAFPPTAIDDSVRWSPGNVLSVEIAPGVLIVEEILLFGRYGYSRRAGESFGDAGAGGAPAGDPRVRTAQRWGVGAMYATPPAGLAYRAGIPFEAELLMGGTLAGSGGTPAARTVEMSARLFPRLWGSR